MRSIEFLYYNADRCIGDGKKDGIAKAKPKTTQARKKSASKKPTLNAKNIVEDVQADETTEGAGGAVMKDVEAKEVIADGGSAVPKGDQAAGATQEGNDTIDKDHDAHVDAVGEDDGAMTKGDEVDVGADIEADEPLREPVARNSVEVVDLTDLVEGGEEGEN